MDGPYSQGIREWASDNDFSKWVADQAVIWAADKPMPLMPHQWAKFYDGMWTFCLSILHNEPKIGGTK